MEDRRERLQSHTKTVINWRGEMLEKMVWLEKYLDIYITNYFSGNDAQRSADMQLYLFGDLRITLDNKREVFFRIAEKYESEWYKNYQSPRKPEKKKHKISMNSDLEMTIQERNKFAHLITDRTDAALENLGEVKFLRFRDGLKLYTYTRKSFLELLNVISSLTEYLRERNHQNQ